MRAMFPMGLTLRWNRMLAAFFLAVAIAWAGTRLLRGLWSLAAVAVVTGLVLSVVLVTWRGAPLSMLAVGPHWPPPRRRHGQGHRWSRPPVAVDHDLGGNPRRGSDLVAVVAVDGPSHSPRSWTTSGEVGGHVAGETSLPMPCASST